MQGQQKTPQWSSEYIFIIAAVGAAVGMGNIWRFPYLAGESGGGAFVLIYIFFVIVLGLPLVMGELALGRHGKKSPVETMRKLVQQGHNPFWKSIGWISVCMPLVTMGFYAVVTGWSLDYIVKSLMGAFDNIDNVNSINDFSELQSSWQYMILLNSGFMLTLIIVVGLGVKRGLEATVKFMMPALFAILIFMAIYSMVIGDAAATMSFLFTPDFSKVTSTVIIDALGQALFSLAIGAGALITYGAYLPDNISIPKAAGIIALSDTMVALVAGLAIFPIVFKFGLEPSEGAGLIFVSLPIAFGQMAGGAFIGALFFLLLTFAAFTTGISMVEPIVSVFENKGYSRKKCMWAVGTFCWLLSILAGLSFDILKDVNPLSFIEFMKDKNIFDTLNFFISAILLPINALLLSVFIGWFLSRKVLLEQFGYHEDNLIFKLWQFSLRYLMPFACTMILINVFF